MDLVEFTVMVGISNFALFFPSMVFKMNNFGYIAIVTMNAFLRLWWVDSPRKKAVYIRLGGYMFLVGQYLLFGLIGTAINVASIDKAILVEILIVILVSILFRSGASYLVLFCCEKFNHKERLVIAFTWIAKATVQVALGGLVLDKEEELGITNSPFGADFAGLSVFAILICAPLGGVLGGSFAKRWLSKHDDNK